MAEGEISCAECEKVGLDHSDKGPGLVPNMVLIDKVMEQIRILDAKQKLGVLLPGEDSWDQSEWIKPRNYEAVERGEACGTAMCFAGWTAALQGMQWKTSHGVSDFIKCDNGDMVHVGDWSVRELCLTHAEADTLFCGGNDIGELESIIKALKHKHNLL